MESPNTSPAQRPRLHPLVATAAVSVILLSAIGIGVLVMNRSGATQSPYDAPPVVAQTNPQTVAPAPAPAPEPAAPRVVPQAPARIASSTPTYRQPAPVGPTTPNYSSPAGAPSAPMYENPAPVAQAPAICRNCGVVDSIHEIKVKGQGTGVGGVGGAVVGGLLGNMVGAGRGKALATVAGAVGGGFAGNAIEKNMRAQVEHQMVVRLNDGTTRTFTQASPFPYGVGERVRIVDGHVERG